MWLRTSNGPIPAFLKAAANGPDPWRHQRFTEAVTVRNLFCQIGHELLRRAEISRPAGCRKRYHIAGFVTCPGDSGHGGAAQLGLK